MRALQKKMQQLENDLDQAQEQLLAANAKLEEKDKALQNVSAYLPYHTMLQERKTSRPNKLPDCFDGIGYVCHSTQNFHF